MANSTGTTATKFSNSEINARITPYSGHKTSDNQLFEDFDDAVAHEEKLVRRAAIVKFCNDFGNRDMSEEELADILEQKRELLLLILA